MAELDWLAKRHGVLVRQLGTLTGLNAPGAGPGPGPSPEATPGPGPSTSPGAGASLTGEWVCTEPHTNLQDRYTIEDKGTGSQFPVTVDECGGRGPGWQSATVTLTSMPFESEQRVRIEYMNGQLNMSTNGTITSSDDMYFIKWDDGNYWYRV